MCPTSGTVTGDVDASDVVGPAGQGIEAGAFGELIKAMRAGHAYVNVHSVKFPGGEIRAQIRAVDGDDDEELRQNFSGPISAIGPLT